jgi:soluble lytic murein transglycosylase-like protein
MGFFKSFSYIVITLLVFSGVCAGLVQADVYSYIDEKGTVHFSNAPSASHFNNRNHAKYLRKYRKQTDKREYELYIRESAKKYKLDPHLVRAVIEAESNFDCYAVSCRGARGLMQLMPGTAGDMEVNNSFNARQNIEGGCRYLRNMLDLFDGNIILAVAAYNAGPRKVKKYNKVPPYSETKAYVKTVLAHYKRYKMEKIKIVW